MPKEPKDDVLIDKYHKVNDAFDKFPDKRQDIIEIGDDCVICSDGKKLPI